MTATTIIQKHLPEVLWTLAEKFDISETSLQEHNELIILILESRSLAENNEKQNWFNLLPIMKEEQIEKLKDILTREKQKFAEINAKYEQKRTEIHEKYQTMFNADAYYKAQAQLEAKEDQHREKDLEDADNLLAQM